MSLNKVYLNAKYPIPLQAQSIKSDTTVTTQQLIADTIVPPLGGTTCFGKTCFQKEIESECLDTTKVDYQLPTRGTTGQVLTSDGLGHVSFQDATDLTPIENQIDSLIEKTQYISVTGTGNTRYQENSNVDNLYYQNSDLTYTLLKPTDQGNPGEVLHTDGIGGSYWAPDIGTSGTVVYNGAGLSALNKLANFDSNDGLAVRDTNISTDGTNIDMNSIGLIKNLAPPIDNLDAVNYATLLEVQGVLQDDIDAITLQSLYTADNILVVDNVNDNPLILKSTDDSKVVLAIRSTTDTDVVTFGQGGIIEASNQLVCPLYNSLNTVRLNSLTESSISVGDLPKITASVTETTLTNDNITNDTTLYKVRIGGVDKLSINNGEIATFGDVVSEKPNLIYDVQVGFDTKFVCNNDTNLSRNAYITNDATTRILDKIGGDTKASTDSFSTYTTNQSIQTNAIQSYTGLLNGIQYLNVTEFMLSIIGRTDSLILLRRQDGTGGIAIDPAARQTIINDAILVNNANDDYYVRINSIQKIHITPSTIDMKNEDVEIDGDNSVIIKKAGNNVIEATGINLFLSQDNINILASNSVLTEIGGLVKEEIIPNKTTLLNDEIEFTTSLLTQNGSELSTKAYANTKVGSITNSGVGNSLVSSSTGGLKGLIAGSGISIISSATDLTISDTGAGFDVLPVSIGNSLVTAGSNVYYMNTRASTSMTLSNFVINIGSGSDNIRVAIYTGVGTTAILKAQSINTLALGIGSHPLPLIAEVGQNLTLSAGTQIVVAVSVGGTSARLLSINSITDTAYAWSNTTEVNISGFPVNPQAQSITPVRFVCSLY